MRTAAALCPRTLPISRLITAVNLWSMSIATVIPVTVVLGTVVVVGVLVIIVSLPLALLHVVAKIASSVTAETLMSVDMSVPRVAVFAMAIAVLEIARVAYVAMPAAITFVHRRGVVVIEVTVAVNRIDSEIPVTARTVNGAIEVFALQKAQILGTGHDIPKIIVTIVQKGVIIVNGIAIAINYVVHDTRYGVDEIIVYLVAVIILHWREV